MELIPTREHPLSHDRFTGRVKAVRLDQICASSIERPAKGLIHRRWRCDAQGQTMRMFYSPKSVHPHFRRAMTRHGVLEWR